MAKIGLISLGCPKNQADADAFYQKLKEKKAAQKAAAQEAEDGEEATVILR